MRQSLRQYTQRTIAELRFEYSNPSENALMVPRSNAIQQVCLLLMQNRSWQCNAYLLLVYHYQLVEFQTAASFGVFTKGVVCHHYNNTTTSQEVGPRNQ